MDTKNMTAATIQSAYLDYVNNYLTIGHFASDYGLTVQQAEAMIAAGRVIQEATANTANLLSDKAIPDMSQNDIDEKVMSFSSGRVGSRASSFTKSIFGDMVEKWKTLPDSNILRSNSLDQAIYELQLIRSYVFHR